jgi:hypothetical protein
MVIQPHRYFRHSLEETFWFRLFSDLVSGLHVRNTAVSGGGRLTHCDCCPVHALQSSVDWTKSTTQSVQNGWAKIRIVG